MMIRKERRRYIYKRGGVLMGAGELFGAGAVAVSMVDFFSFLREVFFFLTPSRLTYIHRGFYIPIPPRNVCKALRLRLAGFSYTSCIGSFASHPFHTPQHTR